MARQRPSVIKRQREQTKRERQQMKATRRQERKTQGPAEESLLEETLVVNDGDLAGVPVPPEALAVTSD
ncbi:MAG TPA: hypothetical protein VGR02_16150 [Thermoanaerobaculia bacterium]|jgi:hypothetical protein|nr:hypothetical protein [Thermoanaerobaculia bacterium]